MKLISIISAAILLAGAQSVRAHDFSATINGQRLYFSITDTTANTAMLTYKGQIADKQAPDVSGDVEIPQKVKHGGKIYTITAIGPKAFSGASGLTGIVIPSQVESIGDFAFEGCESLEKVVFPGGNVSLGQGTFFRCGSLRDLSFGSDWKEIDLKAFRWSDSLRSVSIPAKVTKIINMKSLRSLENIVVDPNNTRFSSEGGALYNKDGTVLYGVPRSYTGTLKIKEGTKTVTVGALIDCPKISRIDVAASVESISFRETSRMESLEEIVIRSLEPIETAEKDATGVMLFQVANEGVKLTIAKDSKKVFTSKLATEAGDYKDKAAEGDILYKVDSTELPSVKNINTVKDIESYE